MHWLANQFVRAVHWLLRKNPHPRELSDHDKAWLELYREQLRRKPGKDE